MWAKSTYDALVARGFPNDTTHPVVDDRIEPSMRCLIGGDECKKDAITGICINFFNNSLGYVGSSLAILRISPRRENGRAFHCKMEEMQVVPDEGSLISVKYIHRTRFTTLDAVIGVGLNPGDIMSREELYRRGIDWDASCVWEKSMYDALVARGFPRAL